MLVNLRQAEVAEHSLQSELSDDNVSTFRRNMLEEVSRRLDAGQSDLTSAVATVLAYISDHGLYREFFEAFGRDALQHAWRMRVANPSRRVLKVGERHYDPKGINGYAEIFEARICVGDSRWMTLGNMRRPDVAEACAQYARLAASNAKAEKVMAQLLERIGDREEPVRKIFKASELAKILRGVKL
jgi:hypothetical protein